MTGRDIPLTSSDLRYVADKVDEIINALGGEESELSDDDWRWGLRVKVWNQDSTGSDVAGVVAPHRDGWLGFYPTGITPSA